MHPAEAEHPETVYRVGLIREHFRDEPEDAMSLAAGSVRELVGDLACATLGCLGSLDREHLVAAFGEERGGGFEVEMASGRRYVLCVDRGETGITEIRLGSPAPRPWDRDNVDALATVHLFDRGGRLSARGRASPDDVAAILLFADGLRGIPGFPREPSLLEGLFLADDLTGSVRADGGLPGARTRELLRVHLDAVAAEVLADAAAKVAEVANSQRTNGLEWGTAFLAYDDNDKRTTAIPCADGRLALLHEDVDLIADHNAFIVGVETGGGGPRSVEVWLVHRYDGSIPAAVAAFADGQPAPDHVVTYRMDLSTGALDQAGEFDAHGMAGTVHNGMRRAAAVTRALSEGELDLGGFNQLRESFACFEPDYDAELEEDDVSATAARP